MSSKKFSVPVILEAAATILQTEGWTKFEHESDGRYCAVGAIFKAVERAGASSPQHHPAAVRAVEALRQELPWQYRDRDRLGYQVKSEYENANEAVTSWNDAKSRTRPQVVRMMRRAALSGRK